ncbi:MAG: hypothetical protein ACPLRH_07265 [Desulfotomaculales bacterium]
MPLTRSCVASLWTKVVLPEEEGPAIRTRRIRSMLAAIRSAIWPIFFSWKAYATRISSG